MKDSLATRPFALAVLVTLILLLGCADSCRAAEVRAFWVDAWGAGFLNQSQVENLLGKVGVANSRGVIRDANCNTVIVQVRRRADVCYPSAVGEPYFSGLSPSGFNALQAMINAAHDTTGGKKRIEVHCWIVTFATGTGSTASSVYYQHNNPADLDNYWVTLDESGNETDDKAFDPGHPKCEQYIVDVCMDLVRNYDIDGLHYDYIRFTAANQGYNPVSIARYNARYGLSGQPAYTNAQFKQWRRDQVTQVVRKVYANIQKYKPWVKQSASVVTWNPSPTASTRAAFQATRPYYDVYADWDAWMQEGILDFAVPMTYYNNASLPNDYTRWINFEKDRKFNRHMVIGPGIYLNSLSNAILQLQMTRTSSPAGNKANGFSGYSFRVPYSGGTWAGFSPTLVSQVTPTWDDVPVMPWKATPTKGHIMGTVTYQADGSWADGATVSITGPESRSMLCDGTGFYTFIDLTPGTYVVSCSKTGYPTQSATVTVTPGVMSEKDFVLGGNPPPAISNVQVGGIGTTSATVVWVTDQPSSSRVEYGPTASYGSTTATNNTPVTNHAVNLSGLTPAQIYHFRVISTNDYGTSVSGDYTFGTNGPPVISDIQVSPITAATATVTWTTSVSSDSTVFYGLSPGYGSQMTNGSMVSSHSIQLTGLTPNQTYHFKVASSNSYGSDASGDLTFVTPQITTEIVIDNTDPSWANTSPNGNLWSSGASAGVPKIGSNYLFYRGDGSTTPSSSTRSCTWTPNLPVNGLYDVYVYYQIGANRNPSAPYTVHYWGGQASSIQNQYSATPNQGGWFLVGQNLPFGAGENGYVELSTLSTDTAYVSSDAAKWVLRLAETTPPTISSVTDEKYTTSTTALNATWVGNDAETGIKRYEYAVGTQPGFSDVKGWTNAGASNSATIGGLSLVVSHTYYISVRGVNNFDMTGAALSSTGVKVLAATSSIGAAKAFADATDIALDVKKVTAVFDGAFYIQDANRASGIRVVSSTPVSVNQNVLVYGKLDTYNGMERALVDCRVSPGTIGTSTAPLSMAQATLGGEAPNGVTPGISQGVGLINIGLLVQLHGVVTGVVADGFYFDDGSGINSPSGLHDETGFAGVKAWTSSAPGVSPGNWVIVRGISSAREVEGNIIRTLLVTSVSPQ